MDSFRDFLYDLCLNTEIEFNLVGEDEVQLFNGINKEISEIIIFPIKLEDRNIDIYIPKKHENSISLLKYVITNKCREIYCIKEKIITDLLNGKEISIDKIENNLCFLQKGTTVFLVSIEENKIEALEIIKQLYLEQEVISLIYGDNILILGSFEDVEDHARCIRELIVSHLYCKCYVSFSNIINDAKDIVKAYNQTKESMILGTKFCFRDEVFSYDKILFEKIVFNIEPSVKQELMNKFKNKFDAFDKELINTIEEFVKCGLNISDASRKLYVHRNTLIYRLEKIKKETGFDIRQFTDATVFIISFLIWKEKYE